MSADFSLTAKSKQSAFESRVATNANISEQQRHSDSFAPTSIHLRDNENDNNEYDDSYQSFLPKPSPPEAVDVSDELSPVCDYSECMRADNQVKVGVSPTDELHRSPNSANDRAYIQTTTESDSQSQKPKSDSDSSSESHSAYENNAFAGSDSIDKFETKSEVRSPYEVVRDDNSEPQEGDQKKDSLSDQSPKPEIDSKKGSDDKGDDDDRKDDDRKGGGGVRVSSDREVVDKVKKQIVSEIFAKELNEEVMNGSPERKLISKSDRQSAAEVKFKPQETTDLDEIDFEEIRREAQIIAQSIVVKAKEELAKIPHKVNISSEISDEDMVEQELDDFEDVKRVNARPEEVIANDIEPTVSQPMTVISPDASKAQKRISFTESETFPLKSPDKSSVVSDKNMSPEELKTTLYHPRKSSGSGSGSSSQKERESGMSSSSESHYHSFDVSDSSRTPATSRPTSSEFDLTIIPEHQCSSRSSTGYGLSPSEYETCATSQEGSYETAATSQETSYVTAKTSVGEGSRDSTISIQSDSSGHLAEMSSEGSETIITEEDRDKRSSVSDDDFDQNGSTTPVNEFKEPYDCDIPEEVIRAGIEMPYMRGSDWKELERTSLEDIGSASLGATCQGFEAVDHSKELNSSLLVSNNSIDESEQNSENSNTWQSSSVGTAINVANQPNSPSLTSSGPSACLDSAQILNQSISESLETLNTPEVQQTNAQYSNGPVEVDYVPEFDHSDTDHISSQSAANQSVEHLSFTQDERTSSSELTSDYHPSDTPLVSQSSLCSSVLSEHARHQLSYDLSPDLHLGASDSLTMGSDDSQRPQSPIPPESEELVFLESVHDKSPSENTSLTPEIAHCIEQNLELYTHPEVDENIEDSPSRMSIGSRLGQSRPVPISSSRSGESSAASSLKEFERLEAEMKGKGSLHGSSDSLGSGSGKPLANRGSDRDDHSVSSSLNEFEKLEKDLSEAERIERRAAEEAARLSEIEEGHESQASDASQETLSGHGNDGSDDTDSDYEKRMSEIDDMIKIHEKSVEKMHSLSKDIESNDNLSDKNSSDKQRLDTRPRTQSQSSSANQKRLVSTDSTDSHHIDSVSTINTESLIERIDDLVEYKDDNKSLSSDSAHEELREESAQELEHIEAINESLSSRSSFQDTSNLLTHESGPALATLREETDFEEDSLKGSLHGSLKPSECMLSSTDSLETSTAGTHATYHCESAMSSSYVTSGDEATMVSSTDTPELLFSPSPDPLQRLYDHEKKILEQNRENVDSSDPQKEDTNESNDFEEIQTYDERGNLRVIKRFKRSVPPPPPPPQTTTASSSSDSEEKFLEMLKKSAHPGKEVIEEEKSVDEFGNLVIKRTIRTETISGPELTSKTVSGQSAERDTQEFLESFTKLQPVTSVDEYEGVDESGNTYKVYQEVTVAPEVRAVTFSGPDAQQKLDQFVRNWSGDKEQLLEVNKLVAEADTNQESDSDRCHQSGRDESIS